MLQRTEDLLNVTRGFCEWVETYNKELNRIRSMTRCYLKEMENKPETVSPEELLLVKSIYEKTMKVGFFAERDDLNTTAHTLRRWYFEEIERIYETLERTLTEKYNKIVEGKED